jgi:hypothetical protein
MSDMNLNGIFGATNKFPQELKIMEVTEPNSLNVAFKAMLTSSAVKLGGTDFEFSEIKYKDYKGLESICKVFNGVSAGGKKISIESVDKFFKFI